jgi:hypothetical protein
VAVSHSGPVRVVLALQTDDIVDLLGHQLLEHAEPDTHTEREQSLLRCPDQLPQRFPHALREHGLIASRLSDRYVATHGGSSLDLCGIAANAPNRSGRGRRDRRHLKVLRAPGQPPSRLTLGSPAARVPTAEGLDAHALSPDARRDAAEG